MARIIVIGGQKGGSGKTTLAFNLAIMAAQNEMSVLLVDSDRQQSLSDLVATRHAADIKPRLTVVQKTVGREGVSRAVAFMRDIKDLAKGRDVVFIDVGGWDAEDRKNMELRGALLAADLLLVPSRPGQLDLWTLEHVMAMAEEAAEARVERAGEGGADRLDVRLVFNGAPCNPLQREIRDAREHIKKTWPNLVVLKTVIRTRAAFSRSITEGRGAMEFRSLQIKGRSEMTGFYDEVMMT